MLWTVRGALCLLLVAATCCCFYLAIINREKLIVFRNHVTLLFFFFDSCHIKDSKASSFLCAGVWDFAAHKNTSQCHFFLVLAILIKLHFCETKTFVLADTTPQKHPVCLFLFYRTSDPAATHRGEVPARLPAAQGQGTGVQLQTKEGWVLPPSEGLSHILSGKHLRFFQDLLRSSSQPEGIKQNVCFALSLHFHNNDSMPGKIIQLCHQEYHKRCTK